MASVGPTGAFLVELLVYNGTPFNDHWAYWVRSHIHPDIGVEIHANGDVRTGFEFEIKREHDFRETSRYPTARIPLQWVDAKYFNEKAVLNTGRVDGDKDIPVCDFEASVHKISVPVKSLVSVTSTVRFQLDLDNASLWRCTVFFSWTLQESHICNLSYTYLCYSAQTIYQLMILFF